MRFAPLRTRAAVVALALVPGSALIASPIASSAGLVHGTDAAVVHGTTSTSTNWSGYDSTSGPFTSVSASWTQPAVTCAAGAKKSSYASFWVGLDGDGSNTVEQTGTDSDCTPSGASYYGWYEMYPAAPVNFANPTSPGDAISASVTYSSGSFTLVLTDATKHWTQTIVKALSKATRFSAEVIAEAPSTGKVLSLANFGTVTFTSAIADGTAIGSLNPDEITMASGSTIKAQPGPLTNGENFSVTWEHG